MKRPNFLKPRLALLDIDGVIADDTHRVEYALKKQWYMYFDHARMGVDGVWPQGRKLYHRLRWTGWRVGYLTGRREDRRVVTELWLRANGFSVKRAPTMRAFAQSMPLANLKTEYLRKLIESGKYSKVVLYDDDPEVIRKIHAELGEEHGVHCTWHIKQKALVKTALA